MQNPVITIGRIVEFHPNNNFQYALPNGMQTAPAIVVQVFEAGVNLNVFMANPNGQSVKNAWTIPHKSQVKGESMPYWDWLPRV